MLTGYLREVLTVSGGEITVCGGPYPVDGREASVVRSIGCVEESRLLALLGVAVSPFGLSIPPLGGEVTLESPLVDRCRSLVLGGVAFVRKRFTLVGDPIPLIGYPVAFIGSAFALVG